MRSGFGYPVSVEHIANTTTASFLRNATMTGQEMDKSVEVTRLGLDTAKFPAFSDVGEDRSYAVKRLAKHPRCFHDCAVHHPLLNVVRLPFTLDSCLASSTSLHVASKDAPSSTRAAA